nr:MAG TPA: hypothetical protein [Caudoviricetes sp.]
MWRKYNISICSNTQIGNCIYSVDTTMYIVIPFHAGFDLSISSNSICCTRRQGFIYISPDFYCFNSITAKRK